MTGNKEAEKRVAAKSDTDREEKEREHRLSSSRIGFMTRSDDLLYQFSQTLRKDEKSSKVLRIFW
jgi:hypothetical protein